MEEVRRILSGYMRPSPSPDEDVAAEAASSVSSAIAAAIAANRAAATAAPEPVRADVPPALSLGIWRPWGVGLSLRLSDVLEVISFDFNHSENDLLVALMTWGIQVREYNMSYKDFFSNVRH